MNYKTISSTAFAAALLALGACSDDFVETAEVASATPAENEIKTPLGSDREKMSYSIGLSIGGNLAAQGMEVDIDSLVLGLSDAIDGKEPQLSPEQMQQVMQRIQQQQREKVQAQRNELAARNKADGLAYLDQNGKKEGVVTTASGLQYKVLTEGSGAKPEASDTVEVHYRGTLIDGTEFDSSYARGETVSFPVNGVIAGWTEALQLMQVGSRWELTIPSDLAYGTGGTGGKIGPNATLVFEVELVGLEKAG